jgi:N-acetylmuramoyl-L-alanine amidase
MSALTTVVAVLASLGHANAHTASETYCLAENIYHEARGESVDGMIAVALVTKNRVARSRFPDTFCEVIYEKAQFSWTLLKKKPRVKDDRQWNKAVKIAARVVTGDFDYPDFVADHYVNLNKADPSWRHKMQFQGRIGDHWFYVEKPRKVQFASAEHE